MVGFVDKVGDGVGHLAKGDGRKANVQTDHKADLFMGRVTPFPPPYDSLNT